MQDQVTNPYWRRNLAILSLTILLSAISWSQIVPFLPLFLKDLGIKNHLLLWSGLVFASQSVASIVTLPFWGKMGDKYGRKPMTVRAGFFLAGIYYGMSVCRAPWQLVMLRFLNGALTGFIPGSTALVATNTPRDRAPKAVATAQTAGALGQILGPPIGGLLAGAMHGYRPSMVISGSAVLLCTIAVWAFVREPNKPVIARKTSLIEDFAISFRSPVLASTMVAVLVGTLFAASVNPVLALHLTGLWSGITSAQTGLIFALLPCAFLLTAHLWTGYGERTGPQRAIMIGLTGAGLCSLCLAFVHGIWLFAGIFFLTGLCLAATSPNAGTIICTRVEPSFQGRAYGMMWSASTVGALIGPLAVPPIGDRFGTPVIFIAVGAAILIGLIPFRALVRRSEREKCKV